MKILFSPPDISEEEIEEVVDTLRSGWITTGPKTKKLEKTIAEYTNADGAICVNSATAAMEITLRLLGIGPGDEVITSAYTYTASAAVIHHVGAKIVLVDTVKDSFFMDYNKLEEAINENTKAIIPVDIAGVPCDYDRIYEILNRKKDIFIPKGELQKDLGRVAIVADSAHSFGSTYHDKQVGELADFTSFSFHAVKNFTTAEGGCLVWKKLPTYPSDKVYGDLQLISLHGQNKDALAKTKLGSWEYDIIGLNYKYNMPDIMAAMGLAQFNRYPALLARRQEIIKLYNKFFDGTKVKPLEHIGKDYLSNGHLYLVRIDGITEGERNEIIEKLAGKDIAVNVHYKPLPMLTAYKNLGFDIKDYPNAYSQYVNEISLPIHTHLSDKDVELVAKSLLELVG